MSAPDTNLELQERTHRPALIGIKAAMVFGAFMMLGLIGFNMINSGDGRAVSNVNQAGSGAIVADTDVYEPGTNSSATPTATD